jgi:protein TonB
MKIFGVLILMVIGFVNISFSQQKKKKKQELQIEMPNNDNNSTNEGDVGPSEVYVDSKDSIVEFADVMPVFPGGQQAMYDWISKNLVYPQEAIEDGMEGKVYVSFIIDMDGSISSPHIMRGIGKVCDIEAIRLVKSMPKWIPGKMNGKVVKVKQIVVVNFKL